MFIIYIIGPVGRFDDKLFGCIPTFCFLQGAIFANTVTENQSSQNLGNKNAINVHSRACVLTFGIF